MKLYLLPCVSGYFTNAVVTYVKRHQKEMFTVTNLLLLVKCCDYTITKIERFHKEYFRSIKRFKEYENDIFYSIWMKFSNSLVIGPFEVNIKCFFSVHLKWIGIKGHKHFKNFPDFFSIVSIFEKFLLDLIFFLSANF